ncbi:MAG: glycosyltransferase family 39 protein, partial [Legionellales bacterium]|nr:glycosyltransferase family 39 protein [Legionellales bacterium]
MYTVINHSWFRESPVKGMSYVMMFFYFGVLLLLAPAQILSFDSYYYWEWSRHLDLSYYDGPPMIAYFIKLSTLLFGQTLLALNMVGIAGVAITAWIIYKTSRLFLNEEASVIATLLWLFVPLNTLDLLKQTTYDVPYILFWALTVYCVANFIQAQKLSAQSIKWLYLSGVSVGCMMLSKYSGIILVLALFVFIITTHYRYLFRSRHFYLSLLLSLIIFSPVIVWNADHNWQSFLFQLATHARSSITTPWAAMNHAFFYVILPSLNFMLLPLVLGLRSVTNYRKTPIPYLCL